MITTGELSLIVKKLNQVTNITIETDEILKICFHADILDCGKRHEIYKHLDIDLTNGHYIEMRESEELYLHIFSLCNLNSVDINDQIQIPLYQKTAV